jgi:hypothetical protein
MKEAAWALGLFWTGAENLVTIRVQTLGHPAFSELLY